MEHSDIAAVMAKYHRPAILLTLPFPPTAFPPGIRSHFGGLPSLPPGTPWPRTQTGAREPDQVVPLIDAAIKWFRRHPGFEPLTAAFAMLAGRLSLLMDDAATPASHDLLEVRSMLATRAEEWKQQWLHEGLQQGLKRGEAAMLLRLLERRFGTLPGWVRDMVADADTPALEEWGLRVLDAASLDEVFGR